MPYYIFILDIIITSRHKFIELYESYLQATIIFIEDLNPKFIIHRPNYSLQKINIEILENTYNHAF